MKCLFRLCLVIIVFSFSISVCSYASGNNSYSNGFEMYNDGEVEFYIKFDDKSNLYKLNLSDMTEEKVIDEHVISMFNINKNLYLLIYEGKKSNILKFDTQNNTLSLEKSFNNLVTNVVLRDNIFYYTEEQCVFSYDLHTKDTNILIADENVDYIYFTEYNVLKYLVKESNNYSTKVYTFNTLSKKQDENDISLLSTVSFIQRNEEPSYSNPYYIHTSYGGLNECIHIANGSVLPNCTGYAWGRVYEILGSRPNLSKGNAGTWYDYNIENGFYEYGKIPYLGAVVVWKNPGYAGHVAVVEVIDGDVVITSESGYSSGRWWRTTRSASDSNLSASSSYVFQGFIYACGYPVSGINAPTIKNVSTVSASSVNIEWTSVAGAASYKVRRRKNGEEDYATAAESVTSTTFTDTGLEAGEKYYYKIFAINGSISSIGSERAEVCTMCEAPVIKSVSTESTSSITIKWEKTNGATSYRVRRRTSGEEDYVTAAESVTSTSFTDTDLETGTKYFYKIFAINEAGPSIGSERAEVCTMCEAPVIKTITPESTSSITIKWEKTSGATSYRVRRRKSGEEDYTTAADSLTTTTFTDTGLETGTKYFYKIFARNDTSISIGSERAEMCTKCDIPVITSAVAESTSSITIQWNEVDNATSYRVRRRKSGEEDYVSAAESVTSTTFTDTGLEPGTKYFYKVFARNETTLSDGSERVELYTLSELNPSVDVSVLSNGSTKIINASLKDIDKTCEVIFAGYKGEKFVTLSKVTYEQEDINTTLLGDIDEIRVMVWDSLLGIAPLCKVTTVPAGEFITK